MPTAASITKPPARVLRANSTADVDNGFSIPTLDIFLRGSLGNWSFLSEVLFDIDEGNTIGVDLDRMQVGYEVGDWLKITAGRFHTSLGYYNTAYPQGGAVYLLADRSSGGRRPARQRARSFRRRPSASTSTAVSRSRSSVSRYDLDVTNGRGLQADDLANGGDANNPKMLNLRLRYEVNGLIIGGNALVDWIAPRGDLRTRRRRISPTRCASRSLAHTSRTSSTPGTSSPRAT